MKVKVIGHEAEEGGQGDQGQQREAHGPNYVDGLGAPPPGGEGNMPEAAGQKLVAQILVLEIVPAGRQDLVQERALLDEAAPQAGFVQEPALAPEPPAASER